LLGSESSTSFSLSGAKVPGDESSREQKFQGAKVPGSESSTYGTFAPGSESTWERKFHNSGKHMHRGLPSLCLLFMSIIAARPINRLYYCDVEVNECNNDDDDDGMYKAFYSCDRNCL